MRIAVCAEQCTRAGRAATKQLQPGEHTCRTADDLRELIRSLGSTPRTDHEETERFISVQSTESDGFDAQLDKQEGTVLVLKGVKQ